MNVLNPLFLMGMLAGLIPLIIHLIHRQRIQRVVFGSVWFLRNAARRVVRHRRAAELILLIVRIILLTLLGLAFARPFFMPRPGDSSKGVSPLMAGARTVAVLVDISASMDFDTRMEGAKKKALAAVDKLRPGDSVAVYTFSDQLNLAVPWSLDHAAARAAIQQLAAGAGGTDLADALRRVNDEIAGRPDSDKGIVVISDFQATGWKRYRGDWKIPQTIALTLLDAGSEELTANIGFERIDVPAQCVVGSRPQTITAQIRNYSDKEHKLAVKMTIGDKDVATSVLTLPPKERRPVVFRHAVTNVGSLSGRLAFELEDGFKRDNVQWFSMPAKPKIKVVVVKGGESSDPRTDDGFYLMRAFDLSGESIFQAKEALAEHWEAGPLEDTAVVVLSNVDDLPDSAIQELKKYIENGGGAMFFVGGGTRPESFNRTFQGIAPCTVDKLIDTERRAGKNESVAMSEIDFQHPIFQVFSGSRYNNLFSARFWRYYEVGDSQFARVLARFEDGAPAVLFKKVGQGGVLMLVSGADLKMNDFCQSVGFVPFLHESVKVLSVANGRGQQRTTLLVNSVVTVILPEGVAEAALTSPAGKAETLTPPKAEKGTGPNDKAPGNAVVEFVAREQGVYKVVAGKSETLFAANLDPQESDFTRVLPDELAAAITTRRGTMDKAKGALAIDARDQNFAEILEKRQQIGRLLLMLIGIGLLVEMIMADRLAVAETEKA